MKKENLRAAIEAALFMSNEPISARRIAGLFKARTDSVKEIIDELKAIYLNDDHGVYILETEHGYQMRVKPEFASNVRVLTPYKDLGKGMLRVLAMVAYKQPITQAEIVKVIGNRTYEYVKRLQERGLIKTVRSGRTKALIATKEFANYFGLQTTEDLKRFFDEISEGVEEEQSKPPVPKEMNE